MFPRLAYFRLPKFLAVYKGLPAPIYSLFAATVINSAGVFVFPFLTLYLTGKLGMSQAEAGRVIFVVSIIYIPGNFIGGKLADRHGRKMVTVIGQTASALFLIPCGFPALAKAVPALLFASVFFDGITDPARSATMTDLTTQENRRTAFSLNYLGHNLGFAVGSLIAGFLFETAPSWLFWGNALASLLAAALIAWRVPETRPTREQIEASYGSGSTEEAHRGTLLEALKSRPILVVFSAFSAWYLFVYAQSRFALPLQARELFGTAGPAIFGTLNTLNAALVILLSTPILALTKHWKPVNAVALAGLFYAAGFGMLAAVGSMFWLYVSTVLWTLGEIINATNEDAYVTNHTPLSHRGRFRAILPLISGLGWTLSPPLVGAFTDRFGLRAAWPLLGAVALIAAIAFWIMGRVEARRAAIPSREAANNLR